MGQRDNLYWALRQILEAVSKDLYHCLGYLSAKRISGTRAAGSSVVGFVVLNQNRLSGTSPALNEHHPAEERIRWKSDSGTTSTACSTRRKSRISRFCSISA